MEIYATAENEVAIDHENLTATAANYTYGVSQSLRFASPEAIDAYVANRKN